jgi:NDP-sugar pyrophosphorylase family protein
MDFAIIAAGEGSRLKKGGVSGSKPMVTLQGVPLIARLMRLFLRAGASRILVVINEYSMDVEAYLKGLNLQVPVVVIKKNTPSSLHSFAALAPLLQSEKFCLTTVDTVFTELEFCQYINVFNISNDCDGLMAVTAFVDDESPLWVKTGTDFKVVAFEDTKSDDVKFVSGGIYCLRKPVLTTVVKAVESGTVRMRNFQRQLLSDGWRINAHPFQKIMDIDRAEDLAAAEDWLATT